MLCFTCNTRYPIMVVTSESMEPAMYRGDLVLVWNRKPELVVGDVPVCWLEGRPMPMVHRIVQTISPPNSCGKNTKYYEEARKRLSNKLLKRMSRSESSCLVQTQYLTEDDNNDIDDATGGLYGPGKPYLDRADVIGIAAGRVPRVGHAALLLEAAFDIKHASSVVSAVYTSFRQKMCDMAGVEQS